MQVSFSSNLSKIDKLQIRGVRSFDNNEPETIQFQAPLTLIVGYNGSGKTTIIECLKYATTGDLPPNSKGGAFIHDPKLCGEKEVMAQVKLSFKATSGTKMVATRSLMLTVKKTARTQKTLESQLLMIKDGEKTTMSSTVAQLDQLIPQYLGVSTAILDSVIFCHQDDSLWPMSEPSVLKKKFDEIFEAMKYTKAITNIKEMGKKQKAELVNYKTMETYTKENRNKADRAERKSQELSRAIEQLREETQALNRKFHEATDKAQEHWDQGAKYEHVVEALKSNRRNQAKDQETLNRLSRNLKMRSESDEWLQRELDQYEQRMAVHEEQKQLQTKSYENFKREIEQTRLELHNKHTEAGKYEEQKANHEKQMKNRNTMIEETARCHHIRGYDTELDDMQIGEYMERISKLFKDQNAAVERVRRETEREMQKVQEVLSKLGERKSVLNEGKHSARQQSTSNDKRMMSYQSDLDRIEIDEGGKALIEANIEDLDIRLQKTKREFKAGSWDSRIEEGNSELRSQENTIEQLNRELVQGTKQAGDLARLDHLKKELKDRRRSLDTMIGAHGDRLQKILGSSWQPSSLEIDFQRIGDIRMRELKEVDCQRQGVSREFEQVEFKLSSSRAELKKGEKELKACVQHIKESTQGEPEDYVKDLEGIQKDRDVVKADADNSTFLKDWYKEGLKFAENKQICRLCTRPFRGEQERLAFTSRIEKLIDRDQAGLLKELKDIEEDLQRAKDAGQSFETWVRLTTKELPRLQTEVRKLDETRETLLRQMEEHDKVVNDREEAKRDVETLSKPVAKILKYNHEIFSFEQQSQELVVKQQDAGLSRTLEDIQEQLQIAGGKSRDLRTNLTKLTTEKERARSQLSTLELDLSKAKNNLTTSKYQLEKKANIFEQIQDLRKLNQEHRDTVNRLDVEIQELAPKMAEEEAKLDDLKARGSSKEKGLQQEASKLADSVHKLSLANQTIQAYVDGGGSANLARCHREIDRVQQEITKVEGEQKQIIIGINKLTEELRNQEETRRTIEDNLTYRRSKREMDALEAEIAKLSAENADADLEHHKKQAAYWEQQKKILSTAETSKMSTMKEKDNQLLQLLDDWNTDYKDAATKYKEAHILVETTKAAVEDLGRYGGALDKAIMRYHSIKMEEINRIIEELWKKTYQGTDVDTILIRSDSEATRGNRSYNYRVCMIKQDAEMDMRGRCSAGQKVLACIIIRLALAECFGVNCGLIALDEPTTNLDHDNIRSLAESLHDIIRARRQQSNFQLIVITHDEEFLKYMKCADFCDNYYRVSRSDRQKSIIERQSLADML